MYFSADQAWMINNDSHFHFSVYCHEQLLLINEYIYLSLDVVPNMSIIYHMFGLDLNKFEHDYIHFGRMGTNHP